MLREFERAVDEVLKKNLEEIPKDNILFGEAPSKLPALSIGNIGFRFDSSGLAEDVERGRIENEEAFSGDGSSSSFRLKEKPMEESLRVEHPLGRPLAARDDFSVDLEKSSIVFKKPPAKGKDNILVRYVGQRGIVSLKVVKLRADYSLDVWHTDREKADQIAEKVVKLLLVAQNDLSAQGYDLRPTEGNMEGGPDGKATVVRLRYSMERELRVEQVVGIIERVELSGKRPLS